MSGLSCENLQLETNGQVRRIRRTEAIADDLAYARIETEGGAQRMAVLVLHGASFWLATLDPKRVKEEAREDVLRYQREAVDVLYAWASTPKLPPARVVPAEPTVVPKTPDREAPLEVWRTYYEQMLALVDWQLEMEQWRGSMEARMESVEELAGLIPEILERLPEQTISPAHQNRVK